MPDPVEYIELGRTVDKHDTYDIVYVTRKKICRSNPTEAFETIQNIQYTVPHKKEEPMEYYKNLKIIQEKTYMSKDW
tara:strand:+ start:310 stop:540 length:231 start_codon:yes stop_codon:yes gene_type:complete